MSSASSWAPPGACGATCSLGASRRERASAFFKGRSRATLKIHSEIHSRGYAFSFRVSWVPSALGTDETEAGWGGCGFIAVYDITKWDLVCPYLCTAVCAVRRSRGESPADHSTSQNERVLCPPRRRKNKQRPRKYVVRILRHRGPLLPSEWRTRNTSPATRDCAMQQCKFCYDSVRPGSVHCGRSADGSDLTGGGGHPCASPLSGVREERAVRVKVRTHRLGRLRGEGAGTQSLLCIDGFVQVQIAL